MGEQNLSVEKCEICGSTVRLRIIRRMIGWGNGFSGYSKPECVCFACCKRLNHHYTITTPEIRRKG
jgi:hypothetical protein